MTTRKMLFVDDRSKRIHSALRQYSGEYEVTIAANVKEALRLLSRESWDVVSLDHDLTGCDFEDPDTPTCGMEIVRYIEKCGWPVFIPQPVFWIHSSNLFAAHLMSTRLAGMGLSVLHKPFQYDEQVRFPRKEVTTI
jgi:hypothetical protein